MDDAQPGKRRRAPVKTTRDRLPTAEEIALAEKQDERQEQKLLRSFISMCVAAHADGKLTPSHPAAPKALRARISGAGGNIKWLEGNRRYQEIFHRAYCQRIQRELPFEAVWGSRT